jgi:hypothetical protein
MSDDRKGEAGAEKKARKAQVRLVACGVCRKAGGTLVKHKGWYVHEGCKAGAIA